MGHYFLNDNNIKSNIRKLGYTYKGKEIKLSSDSGVFCKDHIDFGTNVLLQSLPNFIQEKNDILDVGCGYGLIGLSIASVYPESNVDMIDVNLRAIELAKENGRVNNLKNVYIFESNVYENVNKEYDYILTNPPVRAGKNVVWDIVIGGYNRLKNNGKIYVVIQKKQGAPSLIEKMEETYEEVNVINKEKGYYIIEGAKRVK